MSCGCSYALSRVRRPSAVTQAPDRREGCRCAIPCPSGQAFDRARRRAQQEGGLWMRVFRSLSVVAVACAFALASSAPAVASIDGGCTANGTATKSKGVDFASATEWHLRTDDIVSGSGSAPANQSFVKVSVMAFGVPIPVLDKTGLNDKTGSAGPYAVSTYSWIARVIPVSGASNSCIGSIDIILDDVNPLATAAGGGAAALALFAVVLLVVVARGSGGAGGRIGGGVLGVVAGIGVGIALIEASILDPRSLVGLALPLGGLIIGAASAGLLRQRN